eukprot:m.101644 g.101644  ORF g.101644 m.101644 type:complete len:855 (+) comp13749_c0_seq3:176-2740(+)
MRKLFVNFTFGLNIFIAIASSVSLCYIPHTVWNFTLGLNNVGNRGEAFEFLNGLLAGLISCTTIPFFAAVFVTQENTVVRFIATLFGSAFASAVLMVTLLNTHRISSTRATAWLLGSGALFLINVIATMIAAIYLDGISDALLESSTSRNTEEEPLLPAKEENVKQLPGNRLSVSVNDDNDSDYDQRPELVWSGGIDDAVMKANLAAKQADALEAKEQKERQKAFGTMRLLQVAKPHRAWLYAGCIVLLIRLPFSLSIPHWISEVIGALIDKNWSAAKWNIIYMVISGTVDSILDFWCVYLFGLAQQRIIRGLRIDLFGAILKQEIGFFDKTDTGEITSRLTADCAEMANDLTWVFRFTIEALVRIGGILAYMFIRSWRLGLLATGIVPIVATVNHFYSEWMHKNQIQVQTALAAANSVATEVISSIRTVFSFAMETVEHSTYSSKIQKYYILVTQQVFIQAVYYMFCNTFLMNMVVPAALLAYGTYLVRSPAILLQPKVLLAFMLYQGQLQEYFKNLLNSFTSLIKSSGAAAKVFDYVDRTPRYEGGPRFHVKEHGLGILETNRMDKLLSRNRNTNSNDGIYEDDLPIDENDTVTSKPASVRFENVHFCYPTRPDIEVLRGINFEAGPGKVVALVGPSGAGKSTCFHLLEHFYEPQVGSVTIDGQKVHTMDHKELHVRVALVSQEPTLMSGSIEDNIMYGCDGIQAESKEAQNSRIVAAATAANAHNFIMELPNGYKTNVGERGVQLSGGQKQRIAIARCLINNPAVLLLDEATSALDSESEALVQDALERAMKSRTTIVIAHRLSTVQKADQILVLNHGKVIESGSHDELMKNESEEEGSVSYRSLVRRQMK